MQNKLTIKAAKLALLAKGITLSKNSCGEFRVNFAGGSEPTAYYTDDLADALNTGFEMRRHAGLTIDDIIELLQEFKAQAGNLRTTVSAIGTPGGNGALRFITLRPDTNISTAKNAAIYGEGR
jgi:hypothetical protein